MQDRPGKDLFSVRGKAVLITGASGGIGRALAQGFAAAGADLALLAPAGGIDSVAQQCQRAGARVLLLARPVPLQEEDAAALVDHVVDSMGRLDVLVNAAGVNYRSPAERFPLEQWQEILDVNLRAVFLLCRFCGLHMLKQGKGKIINVASLLSFSGGWNVPAYTASKGAVAQLTKALANEWAGRGVHVNALAPGYVETTMTRPLMEDPRRGPEILSRIPAGRWGQPQDLIGPALFLASDASNYVHGHLLVVDGGWMAR